MTREDTPTEWTWVEVAPIVVLPPKAGREFTVGGQRIALFNLGDRVAALGGLCPHQGAHLADGTVDPDQATVTCSRRGCLRWRFNLTDGIHTAGLPVACRVFPVTIRAGVVWVALSGR